MSFNDESRRAYCSNAHVRARILEFFGDPEHDARSAMFLTVGTESGSLYREALPVEELSSWLDRGAEINRSLWDRESLICHLDIEYVNFDDHAYPFLNEERVFLLQQPVVAAAEEVLAARGIYPLKLMTGRGYHLVWKVSRTSGAFVELAGLGHLSASLKRLYATERAPTGEHVTPELGAAFAGLGLVMEFIGHEVKDRAAPNCEVPVELGAIETGRGPHGREMISVDITEYADPLCSRSMRAPFSVYLKPAQQRFVIGDAVVEELLPLVVVPFGELSVAEALAVRHDPNTAAQLAKSSPVIIPEVSRPMKRLLKDYGHSRLARFHAEFYAQDHYSPARWPETYDRAPLDPLPP